MTQRERFHAIFSGQKPDRIPLYYFGTWTETEEQWKSQGVPESACEEGGPQLFGMDTNWEKGMWSCQGLVNMNPIFEGNSVLLEQTDDYAVWSHPNGSVVRYGKHGSSIPYTHEHALKPTRESWERFKIALNPADSRRIPQNQIENAKNFAKRERVATFMGGSLYGWIRDWMGVEELSYFMYDEPRLFGEIIDYIADYFIKLYRPFIKYCDFDFVYFFEDCCGSSGPLYSPDIYVQFFKHNYEKLVDFYKNECKIPFVLLDSDGYTEPLTKCWLDSGIDILFPVEVGKWNASITDIRAKYGEKTAVFGNVDKFIMMQPKEEIIKYLEKLKIETDKGYFLPIPDHRIPPEISLEMMNNYIDAFHTVFNKK